MKAVYVELDLCDPDTSVSVTINGPAPIILAMFVYAVIDRQNERFKNDNNREPNDEGLANIKIRTLKQVRGTVQADILKEDQG